MFDSSSWSLLTILGPIVLAVAFIYVFVRQRRLTTREKVERHHAVEELYHDTPAQKAEREREVARESQPRA